MQPTTYGEDRVLDVVRAGASPDSFETILAAAIDDVQALATRLASGMFSEAASAPAWLQRAIGTLVPDDRAALFITVRDERNACVLTLVAVSGRAEYPIGRYVVLTAIRDYVDRRYRAALAERCRAQAPRTRRSLLARVRAAGKEFTRAFSRDLLALGQSCYAVTLVRSAAGVVVTSEWDDPLPRFGAQQTLLLDAGQPSPHATLDAGGPP